MQAEGSFSDFWSLRYAAAGGPLTQRLSQYLGAMIAYIAQRLRLTPNVLTLTGLMLSVLGSMIFASTAGFFAGLWSLLLYQLSYGFDCADGQLARATHKGSEYGAWLDVNCDAAGILAMAFALVFFFQDQGGLNLGGLLAVACMALGRIVHLYSVPAVKAQGVALPSLVKGRRKTILWLLIDTPFFYLCVCGLHGYPNALMSYLALMGVAYGLAALNNVRRLHGAPLSLKPAQESEH